MSNKLVVIDVCPWCAKSHSSDKHDIDWHFACCGFTLLVWRLVKGVPVLEAVPEDCSDT